MNVWARAGTELLALLRHVGRGAARVLMWAVSQFSPSAADSWAYLLDDDAPEGDLRYEVW